MVRQWWNSQELAAAWFLAIFCQKRTRWVVFPAPNWTYVGLEITLICSFWQKPTAAGSHWVSGKFLVTPSFTDLRVYVLSCLKIQNYKIVMLGKMRSTQRHTKKDNNLCVFFFSLKKCFECPSQHLLDNKVSSICPWKLSRFDHCFFVNYLLKVAYFQKVYGFIKSPNFQKKILEI